MITISAMRNILEGSLNEIATAFKFKLHANMGDYKEAMQKDRRLPLPLINGVLMPLQSTVVPVQDLNNYYTQMQLEILVPEMFIDDVQGALMQFITEFVGAAGNIGEGANAYAYVLNMNIPDVGTADIFPHIGKGMPISTTVYFQFIKGGILSNNCKIKIDGEEILGLDYSIARARINQTDNLSNSGEMQSVITQQGLQFNMTIPYLIRPKVLEIAKDITVGGIGKTYTLEYADGHMFVGEESPAWLVTMKDGSISYQPGKVPTILLTFLIARSDINV